jgi:hypothetical protein
MPAPLHDTIFQIIMISFFLGALTFNDALHFTITMCLKLREIFEILAALDNLMDDDSMVVFELALLISNIKKEACNILEFFFSSLRKYEKKII